MLTEYSSYDDIRKFRDKVIEKYEDIKLRWLEKDIHKYLLWCKNNINKCKVEDYGEYPTLKRTFKVDGQVIDVEIASLYCDENGRLNKKTFSTGIYTYIETNKGKIRYAFLKNSNDIYIYTPHFMKRRKERFKIHPTMPTTFSEVIPYTRNGNDYELRVCIDSIMITRRVEKDFVKFITFLHKDMCTSKNYQELFERAGKAIDEHDIYEWK